MLQSRKDKKQGVAGWVYVLSMAGLLIGAATLMSVFKADFPSTAQKQENNAASKRRLRATPNPRLRGLILVDIQHDFVDPKGNLSVFASAKSTEPTVKINDYLGISHTQYVDRVNSYINNNLPTLDFVVYSIDYHPAQHCSFARRDHAPFSVEAPRNHGGSPDACDVAESHGDVQVLWPEHCVQQTPGAQMVEGLVRVKPLDDSKFHRVHSTSDILLADDDFKKGAETIDFDGHVFHLYKGLEKNVDSYSAFLSNTNTHTGLHAALNQLAKPQDIELMVMGVAYDYCAGWTAIDAANLGYETTFDAFRSAPVMETGVDPTNDKLKLAGSRLSSEL